MSFTFFATDCDILEVWRMVLEMPGMRLLERYSKPDEPNRWPGNFDEIKKVLGSQGSYLTAWFEPAGGQPEPRWIPFTDDVQRQMGGMGRTMLSGLTLIDIVRRSDQRGCLVATQASYLTERGARQLASPNDGDLDKINWRLFASAVGKLTRRTKKMAPARLGSHVILPDAYRRYTQDGLGLWAWGEAIYHPSERVTEKTPT